MRKINAAGIELIKSFEGCRLESYICPAGVVTLGFGSTGKHIKMGMKITQQEAEAMLKKDLEKFEQGVSELVKVEISENEYSGLVSFAFNVGLGALKSSSLLKLLNDGKHREASAQFLRWNKGGGKVLPGLTRRREAEKALFLKKD